MLWSTSTLQQRGRKLAQGICRGSICSFRGVTLTAATASIVSWFVVSQFQPVIKDNPSISAIHTSTLHSTQQTQGTMPQLIQLQESALYGLFVADALSMPVHWYYDPHDIKRDFGWIKDYQAPRNKHPSSILTISAIGGAGRSTFITGKQRHIIGDVILHGKLKYWNKKDRSVHYHQGMKAGDNTLNAHAALRAALQASKDPQASDEALLTSIMTDYVHFMTTPGTHNDTYAESSHREFFKSWDRNGGPTESEEVMVFVEKRMKDLETQHLDHNIDGVGSLVHQIPLVIQYADRPEDVAARQAVRLTRMTHASVNLDPFVDLYARTLHAVLNGAPLRKKVCEALSAPPLGNARTMKLVKAFSEMAEKYEKDDRLEVYQNAVSQMGLACYIKGAMTSMFFLAYEFHDDFERGVLTNTNCGGENCHRGAALGALLGAEAARTGKPILERFKAGLHSLKSDIDLVVETWARL